ncbi:MAG: helix-turn-helix domain-containing protein [Pseudomonadota bacterium]
MTAGEFKEARISLGLSQAQLGVILNTNPATIRKWEAEEDRSTSRAPNPVAVRAMHWMLEGFRPPEWPGGT